ncbi:hypothetical protein AX774_g2508 [Zancudomyces culisetae]|uniref:Uncharacterized protein n=1 Tax=Zancudomyces culisetae TaxID=1213189 RepID=A0A1R1PSN6_ZANCU|nr:hypothetical protein AX774_g2508 [Zancudomyces culisetae]|eukprot:OMH83961.1 hypothetical protein AX774_g2508 [Zancudomyces culisetae]
MLYGRLFFSAAPQILESIAQSHKALIPIISTSTTLALQTPPITFDCHWRIFHIQVFMAQQNPGVSTIFWLQADTLFKIHYCLFMVSNQAVVVSHYHICLWVVPVDTQTFFCQS